VGRAGYGLIAVPGPAPSRSHTGAFCRKDPKGRPLSGEHRYTITLDLKGLPPVEAFWPPALYDKDSYLVDNPLNRNALGVRIDPARLLRESDDRRPNVDDDGQFITSAGGPELSGGR
jgi:hypothetical protein